MSFHLPVAYVWVCAPPGCGCGDQRPAGPEYDPGHPEFCRNGRPMVRKIEAKGTPR
jgi:hypothetical protein